MAPSLAIVGVGLVMAWGGLTSARRVAETMSHRVTQMNPGQGFTANIITSVLVIGASRFGMPVSTTHVSCGSLFGIGAATQQAHWRTVGTMLLGDLDQDEVVGIGDLATLLSNYGETTGVDYWDGDMDYDGDIQIADLALLLSVYGDTCPQ